MGVSIIDAQREIILNVIRQVTRDDWKVLVLDPQSRKLIDNVVDQDVILNENIMSIELITDRRATNRDADAIYLITPQPWIVDCVMADFEKRKYRRSHLVWTSLLPPALRERIDKSPLRDQIALFKVLNVEFFPRESHLITFRDPWSFPILYHPACNNLVRQHLEDLAQKVVGVCVALGEYPTIRYYRPRTPTHEASILCSHMARFVQDELDLYAKFHDDFPPATTRPRGVLYIVDRSIDLYAPILHEFTYQAMAHDLLPIKEGDKVTYRMLVNEGQPDQADKDVEISEKDKIWAENRHRHMVHVIGKLESDFKTFLKNNANFTNKEAEGVHLNTIKDMMAGLPEFTQMKEAYSLHLGMANESMNRFQRQSLPDVASVEQILATGLDEEYKKPKGVAAQVVATLDQEGVIPPDRLRLLMLFILWKDGLVAADLQKLLAHAQLPPQDGEAIHNLEVLGARTTRNLKDSRPIPQPLFPLKPPPMTVQEEYALSRYEPVLQNLLEAHAANNLDATVFPYTKPPLDTNDGMQQQQAAASLRSAKPTWAKTRTANAGQENRQRVIVFMAGGATYSEARACYEVGRQTGRETFLVTSHMLTPSLFVRQLGDLSADKRRLNIPAEMPKPQAPRHLFEPDEQPKPKPAPAPVPQAAQRPPNAQPPTQQMGAINLNGGRPNGSAPSAPAAGTPAKLHKDKDAEKKEKKKHHFGFGRSKDK